jgi:hypothetical protein
MTQEEAIASSPLDRGGESSIYGGKKNEKNDGIKRV